VVEFQDSSVETNVLLQTLESTWLGLEKNALLDPSLSEAINEILKFPENVEPNFFHGNLLLMLGLLYWRNGKSKDALRFLNAALDIGKEISHQKLEAQCIDALVLIESDPKNKVDNTTVSGQAIPLSLDMVDNQPGSTQSAKSDRGIESPNECQEKKVINLQQEERGVDMKESDPIFDHKTSSEWNELGNNFLRAGSYNDAINAFTKAIELAPDLSWPYIRNLASAHYHKGKIKGKLNTGKIEDPDVWESDDEEMEPIPYFNQENLPPAKRADSYEEVDINKQATSESPGVENVVSFDQASQSMDVSDAQNNSVTFRQQSTPPPAAIPADGESIKQDAVKNIPVGSNSLPLGSMIGNQVEGNKPQSAFDLNELGNSYASAGEYEKAIAIYKKSIEMDPRFGKPYSNLGFVLYQTGKFQNAVILLTRSLEFLETPEDKALSWNRLGDVYRRMRDYGNALVAYQKASQLKPDTNPVLARARLSLMDSVAVG
jgi:tetratricopeptide (TPR) repeat protein